MASGGFNGTDPAPALEEFKQYVSDREIRYFIRGRMMMSHWGGATNTGSRESIEIAEWVKTH
jgi:hypothetical protein